MDIVQYPNLVGEMAIRKITKKSVAQSIGAVSYTHLDVYKRQTEHRCKKRREQIGTKVHKMQRACTDIHEATRGFRL